MNQINLAGETVKASGNGRSLGYPTANIAANTDARDGVYFGFADLGKYTNHPALIFIGVPTTVGDDDRRVEAHLLDIPDKDHYGEHLNISAVSFYRQNQTFSNLGLLQEAMHEDELAARDWFAKNSNSDSARP